MKKPIKQGGHFKYQLCFSPDESIYYYQRTDTWQVSRKSYESRGDALVDYPFLDSLEFEWD